MARLTLREASALTGRSKSTIQRAIKNGRLSAGKNDIGGYQIDPAELFRVYPHNGPAVPAGRVTQRVTGHDATPLETAIRLAAAEAELSALRDHLLDLRQERDRLIEDRDGWRDRAERLLTDQRSARPAAAGVQEILTRLRAKSAA